jgi:hypothetical protein
MMEVPRPLKKFRGNCPAVGALYATFDLHKPLKRSCHCQTSLLSITYGYFTEELYNATEPVFVNLLRSPGIDSQPGGIDSRAR